MSHICCKVVGCEVLWTAFFMHAENTAIFIMSFADIDHEQQSMSMSPVQSILLWLTLHTITLLELWAPIWTLGNVVVILLNLSMYMCILLLEVSIENEMLVTWPKLTLSTTCLSQWLFTSPLWPGARAYSYAFFGRGIGPIHLMNVGCTGTESRLFSCRYSASSIFYCGHYEDAGVRCQGNSVCVLPNSIPLICC